MNLRAFGRMAWNDIELAAHEVAAVIEYAAKLIAARPAILDLAKLVGAEGPVAVVLSGVELTIEEIEKVRGLARTFALAKAPAAPAAPAAPDVPPEPQV